MSRMSPIFTTPSETWALAEPPATNTDTASAATCFFIAVSSQARRPGPGGPFIPRKDSSLPECPESGLSRRKEHGDGARTNGERFVHDVSQSTTQHEFDGRALSCYPRVRRRL